MGVYGGMPHFSRGGRWRVRAPPGCRTRLPGLARLVRATGRRAAERRRDYARRAGISGAAGRRPQSLEGNVSPLPGRRAGRAVVHDHDYRLAAPRRARAIAVAADGDRRAGGGAGNARHVDRDPVAETRHRDAAFARGDGDAGAHVLARVAPARVVTIVACSTELAAVGGNRIVDP